MQKNEKILKRQSTKIFFDNDDTDFFFNWMLGVAELFGMSHGELFYLAHKIGRDGKPSKWRACSVGTRRSFDDDHIEIGRASCRERV